MSGRKRGREKREEEEVERKRKKKKSISFTSAGVFALENLKVDSFPPAVLIENDSPSSATDVLPNLPMVESNSSR